MQNLKRLAAYLVRYWRMQVVALFVTAAATGLNLVIPLFFMLLIDRVIAGREVNLLTPLMSAFLATLLVQALLGLLRDVLFARVSQMILRDIRLDLCRHILRWPYATFHRERVGQLMSRIQSDTRNIPDLLSTIFVATFADIVTLVVAIVIIFTLNWRLSLLALACLPFFLGAFVFFRRRTGRAASQTQVATASVNEELQTAFSSIKEIKAQWVYRAQERRFADRLQGFLGAALHLQVLQSVAQSSVAFLGTVTPVAVLWFGAGEVLAGRLTLGQLVAFNSLVVYLFGPSQRLAQLNISLQVALASAARVFEYADRPKESEEGRLPFRIRRGAIRLENVHFAYLPGQEVLSGVNLDLPANSRSALVGPSGSGKSTVADVMLGLYAPTAGRISADDRVIASIRLASLRLQVACVAQDPVLFKGTVASNISFVKPGAKDKEVREVARVVGVDSFTGIDDEIGERGVTLSLGQRQRVGIARAILKRPAILVLDEATSGLDPETEKQVWLALSEWLQDSTILVITHRLLSVSNMDRIYFISQGRIVEEGTHDELMSLSGAYSSMFQEQFRQTQAAQPGLV